MNEAAADRATRVTGIFAQAHDLPHAERQQLVNDRCAGDAELLEVVGFLLDAYDRGRLTRTGDGRDGPTATSPPAPNTPDAAADVMPAGAPGGRIGRYRLLQPIGEGGFGTVYMAEQQHPIRRRVALKIIKLGMDTKQVVARFESERQALAMMDHPNIARVLDAGATETGRPYFVMELVKGVPITEYCDKEKLGTRQRLQLFVPVCHAVQHAHQKGIIHRDVKPSNVLVTLHDGRPVPKVIDFGVAKATQSRLTEKTLFTEFNQLVGTPEYMSPEQAEMSGLDVDTRSDVYSLGVLLYELLTGTTPFDSKALRSKGYAEIQRIIREVEPPKPSTRLASLGERLRPIASCRRTDPRKLGQFMRGELDWIVMKCLEKDRTRRYETASALAADVERHLGNEPVLARRPTNLYRLSKVCRRHTLGAVAVTAVLFALVGGLALAMIGVRNAEQARRAAVQAKGEVVSAVGVVKGLMHADAEGTIPQEIDKAVGRLDAGWLGHEPEAAVGLRSAIGLAYADTNPEFARVQLAAALARSRRDDTGYDALAAHALLGMAKLEHDRKDFASADRYLNQALAAFGAGQAPAALLELMASNRQAVGDSSGAAEYRVRHAARRVADLTEAVAKRNPERYYGHRGVHLARLGRFEDAAADLSRFTAFSPAEIEGRLVLGLINLHLGRDGEYRKTAGELLAMQLPEQGSAAVDLLMLCVLSPEPVGDESQHVQLLERSTGPQFRAEFAAKRRLAHALFEYRAGRVAAAGHILQTSLFEGRMATERPVVEMLVAACCHADAATGAGDAKAWYDRAVASASCWPKPGDDTLRPDDVPRYLAFQVLKRQVEKMIGRDGPAERSVD